VILAARGGTVKGLADEQRRGWKRHSRRFAPMMEASEAMDCSAWVVRTWGEGGDMGPGTTSTDPICRMPRAADEYRGEAEGGPTLARLIERASR
jgi:hypothetical protein